MNICIPEGQKGHKMGYTCDIQTSKVLTESTHQEDEYGNIHFSFEIHHGCVWSFKVFHPKVIAQIFTKKHAKLSVFLAKLVVKRYRY